MPMENRTYLLIWLVSLFTLSAVAEVFPSPGYMDSYYYYHVAANLASGRGLIEDFAWNYLTHPSSIPQPANLYWMPLTSFIAVPFLAALGMSFRLAQLPFSVLASLVPPLTAWIGWRLTRDLRVAVSAAFLTLFAGFYLSYWAAIDSFGSFALSATAALVLAERALRPAVHAVSVSEAVIQPWLHTTNGGSHGQPAVAPSLLDRVFSRVGPRTMHPGAAAAAGLLPDMLTGRDRARLAAALGCGAAIAIAHLARADGILLLGVVWLLALIQPPRRVALALALAVTASYAMIMLPWWLRNTAMSGSPFAVGATRTILLRSYDEMFSFLETPNPAAFLDWGAGNIVWSRLAALGQNLGVFFGGSLHLAPLAAVGVWQLRHQSLLRPFLLYGLLLYLVHSLVFAFPGPRGTLLHSAVALLPWLAVAAVAGLHQMVAWTGTRLPHWDIPRAQRNFGLLALAGSALVSLFFTTRNAELWNLDYSRYIALSAWVQDHAPPDALIFVANPPAFAYTSGRASLVTPSDGIAGVLAAADRYGVAFLALEEVHARTLDGFYNGTQTHARLERLGSAGSTRLFAIRPAEAPPHAARSLP